MPHRNYISLEDPTCELTSSSRRIRSLARPRQASMASLSQIFEVPPLDSSLGAVLLGVIVGSMYVPFPHIASVVLNTRSTGSSERLYGLTVHQTYRYFKLYPEDRLFLKSLVRSFRSSLSTDTESKCKLSGSNNPVRALPAPSPCVGAYMISIHQCLRDSAYGSMDRCNVSKRRFKFCYYELGSDSGLISQLSFRYHGRLQPGQDPPRSLVSSLLIYIYKHYLTVGVFC